MRQSARTRPSRRLRWLAVLAALSLGASTVAAAQPAEAKPDRRDPVPVSRYVALGDSYAAGEGLAPYEDGTDNPPTNACHRSETQSYPVLLETSTLSPFQNLTSVACSGASTAALFGDVPDRADEPGQLAAVTADTTTVTLSIGGNDAGFAQVLLGCVYSPSPDLQSVAAGQAGCKAAFDPLVKRQIAALSGRPKAPSVSGVIPHPRHHQGDPRAGSERDDPGQRLPETLRHQDHEQVRLPARGAAHLHQGQRCPLDPPQGERSERRDQVRRPEGSPQRHRRALRQRGERVRRPQRLRSATAVDQLGRLRSRTVDLAGQLPPHGSRPVRVCAGLRRGRLRRSPVPTDQGSVVHNAGRPLRAPC